MKVSINVEKFQSKPAKSEIGKISKNIFATEMSVEEIANALATGQSICPAVFYKDIRQNNEFKEQQLFMLDFDDGTTVDEVLRTCNEWDIYPSFIYHSFSYTPELEKFRVVFTYPIVIDDKETRDSIQRQFMALFTGKIDKSCKDSARMFFGTNNGIVYSDYDKVIDPERLQRIADAQLNKNVDDNKTKNRNSESLKIGEKCHFLDIPLYNIKTGQENGKNEGFKIVEYEAKDDTELRTACKAYSQIMDGVDLHHQVKFGILTSVQYMPKLRRAFVDKLQTYNDTWNNQFQYIRRNEYQPMKCINFDCPFVKECGGNCSVYSKVKSKVDYVLLDDTTNYISVEKQYDNVVDNLYKYSIRDAEQNKGKIILIKSQTGIGKSEVLSVFMTENNNLTYCFPNHSLKNEFHTERLLAKSPNLDVINTPDFPVEILEKDLELIKRYYSVGMFKKGNEIIKGYGHIGEKFLEEKRVPLAGRVLTTHKKIFYNSGLNDVIIFDEDPIQELISVRNAKRADITLFYNFVKDKDENIAEIVSHFNDSLNTRGKYHKTPVEDFVYDVEELINYITQFMNEYPKTSTNFIELFQSQYWVVNDARVDDDIFYSLVNELPKDKTVIILSATVDADFYRYLFGNRVVYVDCGKSLYKGKINQFVDASFSRNGIATATHYEKRIEAIAKTEYPTITYKYLSRKINKNNEYETIPWFGKCCGFDEFNGLDINVVGTPMVNEKTVFLYALACGIHLGSIMGARRDKTWVKINNVAIEFYTFENHHLQVIDLFFIRNELEQAIGRARVLRNDCNVYVYSTFPVEQAIIKLAE